MTGAISLNHHLFRWVILIAGFTINMCLGILYAWSIFVPTLESEFGLSRTEVSLPFTVATLTFSFGMIFTGRLQDKLGPRVISLLGSVLAGGGYMLSSISGGVLHLMITYGLVAGLGNAAGYIAAVSSGLKWFPDKRGLASGIVVGGYGIGALIFAPIATNLIGTIGWRTTFLILGLFFLTTMSICSIILKNPSKEASADKAVLDPVSDSRSSSSEETMWKTLKFYILWNVFFLSCFNGLMTIAHLKPFATTFAGLSDIEAAFAVSILSALNFVGRILLGWVSDAIGRIKTLVIISVIMSVNMAMFPYYTTTILLYVGAAIVGLCFGTNLGLFPAITADNWGTKHLGFNYGIMLTAWGIGGLAGPIIGGYVYDATGYYTHAFWIGSMLAIVSLIFLYIVKRERFGYRERAM